MSSQRQSGQALFELCLCSVVWLTSFVSVRRRSQDGMICSYWEQISSLPFLTFSFLSPLFSDSLFLPYPLPLLLFHMQCSGNDFLNNNDLILLHVSPLPADLWQRVRPAAAAACQPPSWCLCPLHLRLPLWHQFQLAQTTRCRTASQESCLPTWRR